jgi:hypothetical protein
MSMNRSKLSQPPAPAICAPTSARALRAVPRFGVVQHDLFTLRGHCGIVLAHDA